MTDKWMYVYEKLVNTDTGFDVSVAEKLETTQFIADILKDLGFDVSRGKGSHIAVMGEPPYVTLIGHLDTVFKRGEPERRPFRVENNIAYGPGVADMKGGVVVMLAALEEFIRNSKNLSIAVVLNVDEEIGSPYGKKDHFEFAKKSRFCLSFETGRKGGAIVLERRGIASIEVEIIGRAGHASMPDSGLNAAVEMADKILRIYDLNDKFNSLSIVPTIASSGYKSNVIPENAYVFFDVRYGDEEEIKSLRIYLEDVFHINKIPGTMFSYKIELKRPPMTKFEEAVTIAEHAMKKIDVNYEILSVNGGGDAAFYTEVGVPSIDGLGIVGRYIHSEKEEAYLDSFMPRVGFTLSLLEELFI